MQMKTKIFMKLFLVIFITTLICSNVGCLAQKNANTRRVDSLFSSHFNNLKNYSKKSTKELSNTDVKFIYLITILSGIEFTMQNSYSGFPNLNVDLIKKWHRWYRKNRSKINWENHILKCNSILEKLILEEDDVKKNDLMKELEKLRIT
jgi:hypothetical protein